MNFDEKYIKKTAKANTVSRIVQLVGILSTILWSREEDTGNLKLLMIKFVDPIFESY